jgi:hypothetical protein
MADHAGVFQALSSHETALLFMLQHADAFGRFAGQPRAFEQAIGNPASNGLLSQVADSFMALAADRNAMNAIGKDSTFFQQLASNSAAFEALSNGANSQSVFSGKTINAIGANARAFENFGANARAVSTLANAAQTLNTQTALMAQNGGANNQGGANNSLIQMAANYPQALSLMAQNAAAFQAFAKQPQALQFFAQNGAAFLALGHDANFNALVTNAAFSAAARSQGFANAIGGNASFGGNGN